jgi:hypothetical protein
MQDKLGKLLCVKFAVMSDKPFSMGGNYRESEQTLKNSISLLGETSVMFTSIC